MDSETSRYLSADEVCELVPGLTKATLAQRRYVGRPPRFLKPTPRLVLYREADVTAWIENSERERTDDGPSGDY
jgi:predicted DNA-binding transcriptional regulator AlpA